MSQQNNRGGFSSRYGILMAIVGSAVGLGNIWRFPFLAGENGGAAFIIIYVSMVAIIGIPLVLSEFVVGKAAQVAPIKAIQKLTNRKNSPWVSIGYISVIVGLILIGFYSTVSGWVLKFFTRSVVGGFENQTPQQISDYFNTFNSNIWESMGYATVFVLICALIVSRGIEKGVEKWNKILLPCLLAMLLFLGGYSMTLSGWDKAVDFLFKPDWSAVTFRTFLDALSQVFFTLSIGMGVMMTYASYSNKKENLFSSKVLAAGIDTSIAILAGIAIFPAVFTFGLEASEGPHLAFKTLPNVFAQLPFGWPLAIAFFATLCIAAITSAVSIMELLISTAIEQLKISRKRATILIFILSLILTLVCALSNTIFALFDQVSAKMLLPVCGLLTSLFVGWVIDKKISKKTFTSDGTYSTRVYPIFMFIVRYIAPLAIAIVILGGAGVI